MRNREIVVRVRLPETPGVRWLATTIIAVICCGAVVYATVPNTFNSGDLLSSAKLNANFSSLDTRMSAIEARSAFPVAATNSITMEYAASTSVANTTLTTTVTPPSGKGFFEVSLSGNAILGSGGTALAIGLTDQTSGKTSGTLGPGGAASGNTFATAQALQPVGCSLTWVEPVNDATPMSHTFVVQYSTGSGSLSLYGALNVVWYPQP